jgi:hypothetical protein
MIWLPELTSVTASTILFLAFCESEGVCCAILKISFKVLNPVN